MTYKYLEIRREMYEKDPKSNIKSYRSISNIVKVFRREILVKISILSILLLAVIIVTVFYPNSPWVYLSMFVVILLLLIIQTQREKNIYKESARANELNEKKQEYKNYILEAINILANNSIDTPEKLLKLKCECEMALNKRADSFEKYNTKIVDTLIGVPLGALIASVIYVDNEVAPIAINTLITMGFLVLIIVKIVSFISFYTEGYFKDKYLMDVLNEISYFDKAFEKDMST